MGQRCRYNSLRISVIGLKCGGGDAQNHETDDYSKWLCPVNFCVSTEFYIFHERLTPGIWLILRSVRKSHHSLKFGDMMSVPWSGSLFKMATISQCSNFLISAGRGCCRSLNISLQWHHNGDDGVSNHQPHYCLLNRLFRRRTKKTPKLPHKGPVTWKKFPFDDVIILWTLGT